MAIRGGRSAATLLAPNLIVRDVDEAIGFYRRAFDATVLYRSAPSGRGMHAQLAIGGAVFMLSLENMGMPEEAWSRMERGVRTRSPETLSGTSVQLELLVEDPESAVRRFVESGGSVKFDVIEMFYGDRAGIVTDPFGHVWTLFAIVEELEPATVDARAKTLFQTPK